MSGPAEPQYQSLYRACINAAATAGADLMQATLERAARTSWPWRPASTTWTATCRSMRPAYRAAAGAGRRFPAGAACRVRAGDRRRPQLRLQLRFAAAAGRRAAQETPTWCEARRNSRPPCGRAGAAGSDACGEPPSPRAASSATRCARRSTCAASIAWSGKPGIAGRTPPLAAPPAAADGADLADAYAAIAAPTAPRSPPTSTSTRPSRRRRRTAPPSSPSAAAQACWRGTRGGRARPRPFSGRASSPTPCPRRWKWCRTCARSTSCCCSCASGRPLCPARARQHGGLPRARCGRPGVPRTAQGQSCTS